MSSHAITRRNFLHSLIASGASGLIFLPVVGSGGVTEPDKLRGDRVGWARLRTPSPWWNRHAGGDTFLTHFLRDHTSLNIEPQWQQADHENLADMCIYPLLFTQEVDSIQSVSGRKNLAEYIDRGGFLIIDSCINVGINPDPDAALARQTHWLSDFLPAAKVAPLPSDHSVFRCHFQFSTGKPPHTFRESERWTKHPLYGIQFGSRLGGVISMSGLQCGWAREREPLEHRRACARMLVNIYVYAMMQGR